MRDFLPIDGRDVGWITLVVIFMITVIRYGATWVRAFGETGNTATATLIAGLQKQIEQQEKTIQSLIDQLKECKENNARLEAELREMRRVYDRLERG